MNKSLVLAYESVTYDSGEENEKLTDLIDDNVRHSFQICITSRTQSSEQHSRRQEEQPCISSGSTLSSNSVPDRARRFLDVLETFVRNSSSNSEG
jgi:GMP synthase-like glutamine amidotransferase